MMTYNFKSAFAKDIEAYLAFKASVGVTANSIRWHLFDFDRWCLANKKHTFNRETVEGWVLWRSTKISSAHLGWMGYIRGLGRWMRANGHPEAYVLTHDFRAKKVRVTPFLMSEEEIERFFRAAATFSPPSPMAWQARCIFSLMYACGLRSSEVMRLRAQDVDLSKRTIDILWSKGHRSRRLPVTDEVAKMLDACDGKTRGALGAVREPFFVTRTGRHLTSPTICLSFRRIWEAAGLPKERGGRHPRPYDFRHHFAYATIERWGLEGKDVMAMLPYLQRYMGHATIESTLYYVHTSPDFLAGFSQEVSSVDALLPKVDFDG